MASNDKIQNCMDSNFEIRSTTADDCEAVAHLIKQLAIYEKCPEEAKLTAADLRRDGFERDPPLFTSKVAEINQINGLKKIVGFVIYFSHYSTWKGPCIFLEDIYVEPEFRKYGIGSALFKSVAQEAAKTPSQRLLFNVLEWNRPSIEFYENRGAINISHSEGWRAFRLHDENLQKFVQEK